MPNFGFKLPGNKKADVSDTPTNAQVLTFNSTSDLWDSQAGGGGGGFSTVYKTADESIQSDTTLTDDADLFFSVDASSVYVGFMYLYVDMDSGADPDMKTTFTIPAGAAGVNLSATGTNIWAFGYADSEPR